MDISIGKEGSAAGGILLRSLFPVTLEYDSEKQPVTEKEIDDEYD